jgi:aspartate/methionine/tyrosine aminotransferase
MICPLLARLLVRSGIARFLPGVQRRLEGGADTLHFWSDRLIGSPLADLERIGDLIRPLSPDVIDLAQGAPRLDLIPAALPRQAADPSAWPAMAGMPELRQAVAELLLGEHRLSFSPTEEVQITAGALGAVGTILDAFVNRGDRVVLLDPGSPLYPLAVRTRGARVRWLATTVDGGRTRFRLDHLARALRGAKLVVLQSPANPTGGVVEPEDLEQVAWWADRHDVLILSDEVFQRFHLPGPLSIATLARARKRTLVVGSTSKGHGLAAARVGWIGANRHLLRPCLATAALRTPFVPAVCQLAALAALRGDPGAFAAARQRLEARRRYAFDRLRAAGFEPAWPAGGFFVWLPVAALGGGRRLAEVLLREQRVRVVPGDLFGPNGAGYVRISVAVEDGRLEEGLNRLAAQGAQRPGTKAA